jgi:hypothetical protein
MAMDRQLEVIERLREIVALDKRVLAAWIAGSFANGTADEYSDVDLHLLVEDSRLEEFGQQWPDLIHQIGPTVMDRPIGRVVGGYSIMPDWLHLDVVCHPVSTFDPAKLLGCLPLVDRNGLLPAGPSPGPSPYGEPYFPADVVDFYYYLLGNLVVVLGRGELNLASNGSIMRRDIGLVPIMLAENGVRKTDGNKRLYPYLADEQRAFLEALPPVAADRDLIIAFDALVAAEVSRRGRALARRTGARWPAEFEQATLDYLRRELAMDVAP